VPSRCSLSPARHCPQCDSRPFSGLCVPLGDVEETLSIFLGLPLQCVPLPTVDTSPCHLAPKHSARYWKPPSYTLWEAICPAEPGTSFSLRSHPFLPPLGLQDLPATACLSHKAVFRCT
jgi:hypothetical protein